MDQAEPSSQVPPARRARLLVTWALALLGIAVGVMAFPGREAATSRIVGPPTAGPTPGGAFLGTRGCRECHPGEAAAYSRSGHASTLRVAHDATWANSLNGRTVPDPERPGVSWSYSLRKATRDAAPEFEVSRREGKALREFIIDYAFGSGHHATTFVSLTDLTAPTAREHRLTHYVSGDELRITPGQRAEEPYAGTTAEGRDLDTRETLKCFKCHATRTSEAGWHALVPAELMPNVACERCHGPGRAHAAAARSGRAGPAVPFGLESATAAEELALCGQCHRHPSRAAPGSIAADNPALARFQPVGLTQSACYKKSDGALRCTTCHDPHSRASTDREGYETACRTCHTGPARVPCPVNPRSGCVDCHMPRVNPGQNLLFSDHWIRVRGAPPSATPADTTH